MEKLSLSHEIKKINADIFRTIYNRYKKMNLEITPMHAKILLIINDSKELLCQKDLEKFISCNKSTLSSIISTMEKNDLLSRRVSETDSRINYLILSEKGLNFINFLHEDKVRNDKILVDGVTDDEYKVFLNVLEKIKKNIERI